MANTPPRASIPERDSSELLDDLCIELRKVGCDDYSLPNGARVLDAIAMVNAIHSELKRRAIDPAPRIRELSRDTGWRMDALLDDCLHYPDVLPFVREADGIRRRLRCGLCGKNEHPLDAKLFWFCDPCLHRVIVAIRTNTPIAGVTLFRTYNADARCPHANDDTVLVSENDYDSSLIGSCEVCISEEINRRISTQP